MGMRIGYLVLFAGLLLCLPASAKATKSSEIPADKVTNLPGQFKSCAKIESRGTRLLCFDQISIDLGLRSGTEQKQTEEIIGDFGLWEGTKIDDGFGDKKYYYKLLPDVPVRERSSIMSQPELVILCQFQTTRVYLDWKDPLLHTTDTKKTVMEYRISSPQPIVEHWDLSTDTYAAFSPEPIEFLKALKGNNKLQMRFTTGRTGVQSLLFSIEGIGAVMDSIVENCYQ